VTLTPQRRLAVATVALLVVLPPVLSRAEPPGSAAARRVHEVKAGETLTSIARRYGTSVSALVRANGLPAAAAPLRVGRQLVIPPAITAAVRPGGKRVVEERQAPPAATEQRRRRAPSAPADVVVGVPEFDAITMTFAWPVDGRLTSIFGRRRSGWHRGIDIKAEPGAPVFAAAAGLVVTSGIEHRYGRVIKIEHDHSFLTVYAHNTRNLVDVGDWVLAGQTIASVGMTGRATTPHVHFEIRRAGHFYNPLYLLPLPPRTVHLDEGEGADDEHDDE
jgi:murein DD-endopeptidase MepM/ murein hydrolase activator NlpD